MTSPFYEKLQRAWQHNDSMLCVGLDPDLSLMPDFIPKTPAGALDFCTEIVTATAPWACAFKPQIAYFSAIGAEAELAELIRRIRTLAPDAMVILDAKRGDIGPTAAQYAREAFVRYEADAVTLNPYLGEDSIVPYHKYPDRGLFLLCRTSNVGGEDLQELMISTHNFTNAGQRIYERVAEMASTRWNTSAQIGLVVGATYVEPLRRLRSQESRLRTAGSASHHLPYLVPGVGAQGGDLTATVQAGMTADGYGLIINSSRAILYAGQQENFAQQAADVARSTYEAIRAAARAD